MPPFERPSFDYAYRAEEQIAVLRRYRDTEEGRQVPPKRDEYLLLATWNISNLGDPGQQRDDRDHRVIAELLSWFDIIAVQEVKDNLSGLKALMEHLDGYRAIFTDKGGNRERLVYLYKPPKVELLELAGEVAIPPADHRYVRLDGIDQKFRGFDRNPYAVAFNCGDLAITLVNVHLYFGSDSTRSKNRRALEAYAVARWADLRRKGKNAYTQDVITLGDFNLPAISPGDAIFDALTKRGLFLPLHSSRVGSSIAHDDHRYDQIAFFPGLTSEDFVQVHVFDFDGAIFSDLWDSRGRQDFNAYLRYHISDHRIVWSQFLC